MLLEAQSKGITWEDRCCLEGQTGRVYRKKAVYLGDWGLVSTRYDILHDINLILIAKYDQTLMKKLCVHSSIPSETHTSRNPCSIIKTVHAPRCNNMSPKSSALLLLLPLTTQTYRHICRIVGPLSFTTQVSSTRLALQNPRLACYAVLP